MHVVYTTRHHYYRFGDIFSRANILLCVYYMRKYLFYVYHYKDK